MKTIQLHINGLTHHDIAAGIDADGGSWVADGCACSTVCCPRVRRLLPEHGHLPVTKEVQRMAVQSFAKRVSMWRPDNAPVSGSRFQDYLSIALMMGRLLGGEEV